MCTTNNFCIPEELQTLPPWTHDLYIGSPKLWSYDDFGSTMKRNRGSIVNDVSAGRGPSNGFLLGKKRVFPRLDAVLWIYEQVQGGKK